MDKLYKTFHKNFLITQVHDEIHISGPTNKLGENIAFISALRHPIWNKIPNTTKIVFHNILIDINEHDRATPYEDIWCAIWMILNFGDHMIFENCYFARNDIVEYNGKYIISGNVDKKIIMEYNDKYF